MILSDGEIKKLIETGELCISPMEESQIEPASVDVRIGNTFCMLSHSFEPVIRFSEGAKYTDIVADKFTIAPGDFVLATTMEYIKLPSNLTAFVEGRSSIGRLGLFVQNAGWVDPGFEGQITLELYNAGRYAIELTAGTRVAQLVFAKTGERVENPYSGKYQKQIGATGSLINLDVNGGRQ